MWFEKQGVFLISDLHLGKENHFRRSGIGVPLAPGEETLRRLDYLFRLYQPGEILVLGDLFHSVYNSSWERFMSFLRARPKLKMSLIHGNHDILHMQKYQSAGIAIKGSEYWMDNLHLTHHPQTEVAEGVFNIAGHLHPSAKLKGRGRQGLRIPCFFFRGNQAILPAFGVFTGTSKIPLKQDDLIYGIVNRKIIPLHERS
jgi:DNA ligase-associated metallophosphoesterase